MKTAQRLAEEKAKQEASRLAISFLGILGHQWQEAYDCAILTVDEIIKALPNFEYGLEFVAKNEFWNNVKQEILKLKNK